MTRPGPLEKLPNLTQVIGFRKPFAELRTRIELTHASCPADTPTAPRFTTIDHTGFAMVLECAGGCGTTIYLDLELELQGG